MSRLAALVLSAVVGAAPVSALAEPAAPAPDALAARARAIFGPLPTEAPNAADTSTPDKVELGRMLYYDPRFSLSQTISCDSCHRLDRFGVDGEATSAGHRGQRGARNSPTTYNAALQFAQFWDGRAADVEAQAKGPVTNPVEMAMPSERYVVRVIESIPGYVTRFQKAFPGDPQPVSFENFAKAIGAFERGLVTPGRFDRFQDGALDALSPEEQQGLATFMDVGCVACHNGPTVGGRQYQKIGLVNPYPTQDVGRYAVTKDEADRQRFKVPSLRNVAHTAPYFHDGSVKTLPEAVVLMAHHQLGKELSSEQTQEIATFLGALTGDVPEAYVARPALPPSGPTTPRPDEGE
jgi:cytochrome c peroxidase